MNAWWKSFLVALIGGAISATAHALTTSDGKLGKDTGIAAGTGALLTGLAYLAQSPITATQAPAPADSAK